MNHPAWASKQLIVPIALALAFAPAGKPAESSSRLHLDRRTNGVERIALLPESSEQNSGEPQEATAQPGPQLSPAVVEKPTIRPPQVTYQDGQLTIIAENSSLSEVMKALRVALGADIDLPAGGADQHIWVHLGPGPARRVLRDLLDGTEFNYMIQASQSDEDGIRSVMLTPRSKSAAPTANPAMPERAANRRIPASGSGEDAPGSENVANAQSVIPPTPAPAVASEPSANEPASSVRVQKDAMNLSTPTSAAGAPVDQMIQQLQSMYQQRRQIQAQQNQRALAPAPNQ